MLSSSLFLLSFPQSIQAKSQQLEEESRRLAERESSLAAQAAEQERLQLRVSEMEAERQSKEEAEQAILQEMAKQEELNKMAEASLKTHLLQLTAEQEKAKQLELKSNSIQNELVAEQQKTSALLLKSSSLEAELSQLQAHTRVMESQCSEAQLRLVEEQDRGKALAKQLDALKESTRSMEQQLVEQKKEQETTMHLFQEMKENYLKKETENQHILAQIEYEKKQFQGQLEQERKNVLDAEKKLSQVSAEAKRLFAKQMENFASSGLDRDSYLAKLMNVSNSIFVCKSSVVVKEATISGRTSLRRLISFYFLSLTPALHSSH